MIKKNYSKEKKSLIDVSVIIPMRNASTTVLETLNTIVKQTYPIREIIVIDNVSKDNSREIVLGFAKKCKIPIELIRQKKDKGVSSSYNLGVRLAKSEYVVFLTSDCSLLTEHELEELVEPLRNDPLVVASYSTSVLPGYVWDTYNFWEKYHAARMVDNRSSLMVLKFDCVRRAAFLKIGGFDEVNFGGDGAIGGEDADLNNRLRNEGKIVRSNANSLHLHYMADDYTLLNMARSRKMYARSYGRYLRKNPFVSPFASVVFLARPALAILPIMPFINRAGIIVLVLYAFFYSKKMFTTLATLADPKILLIPILNILFLYYETYWMARAFFSYRKVI